MNKTTELLLTETIDHLGIVGDVVRVRAGYARNFLLPRGLATEPSDEAVKALADKRAEAEKKMRQLREQRERMVETLEEHEITLVRACNDQGQLYGSVTQRDIAEALVEQGYNVRARDVRIPFTIKRVDSYRVPIKLDWDLETEIKLWVVPDRELPTDEREEMDFDEEGRLISAPPAEGAEPGADQSAETTPAAGEKETTSETGA